MDVQGPGATPEELEEIEAERARRLDPANRPEGAEVDNTGDRAPDLSELDPAVDDAGDADDPADDPADDRDPAAAEGAAGSSDPSARFREQVPSEEEVAEIEAERERRLAPENRPENAEVDNTGD